MQAPVPPSWPPRLAAFVLGLLLAGSVVYWVLHWPAEAADRALPPSVSPQSALAVDAAALARVLGEQAAPQADAVPADAGSRFRLTGIIASASGQGVALVSVDGKPSKPFRVGSVLEDGLMLQSVEARRVALASDAHAPVRMRLELPPKP